MFFNWKSTDNHALVNSYVKIGREQFLGCALGARLNYYIIPKPNFSLDIYI